MYSETIIGTSNNKSNDKDGLCRTIVQSGENEYS